MRLGRWRASPVMTVAVPVAPCQKAWALLAEASSAQRASSSIPMVSRAEVDGLDQGGADAAHRVEDQVAGLAVGGDGLAGDGREHLGWMGGRSGQVSAGSLAGGGLLGGWPHR
jgi:hypothetical protein